ncbi:DNA-3-methyladenine glycosylase family protein [Paenibacillus tarimensis]|uniref:DNA-3-methyladenine glycosylase family protein n=1 Tax=Paenibacillus tarimensis TaxID=416012 RepID=UPI0039F01AC8
MWKRDNMEQTAYEALLKTPRMFSFTQIKNALANASRECLYRVADDRIYKAIPAGQGIYVVEISEAGPEALKLRILQETAVTPQPEVMPEIIRYVTEWFDLDTDLAPFYAMAGQDTLLKQTIDTYSGLRLAGIPDLFEALCWGIIGQQINLSYAHTLKRRIVERYGRSAAAEGEQYWVFPAPETIAALSVPGLKGLGMSERKSEYLIDTARMLAQGKLTRELLQDTGDLKKAEAILVSIRGIGPWTANYVLMRCLKMPTAFPADDVGLHNAIKLLTGMDRKPTRQEVLKLAEPWKGWESYATFYLWRTLY